MEESTKIMLILMAVVIFLAFAIVLFLKFRNRSTKPDEYKAKYPSTYLCIDGHKVRSLSELIIDDFFYRNGIKHEYEDVIIKTVNKEEKQYKYDWFFPDVDVYVEFFGYSGNKYQKNTADKKEFYRAHSLNMIALTPEDLANVPEQVPEKFGQYWEKVVQKRHCPNCGGDLDNRI